MGTCTDDTRCRNRLPWNSKIVKTSGAFFLLLLLATDLNAGIVNGDFSGAGASPDTFSGWITDVSNFVRPTDGGGFAKFDSSDLSSPIPSIHLAQSFALDSGSSKLSFEFNISSTGTYLNSSARDSFQITLFDSSTIPVELFPSNPPLFTAFYSIDNDGLTESFDANFVTSQDIGGGFKRITLDVSSLTPQTLFLDFLLNGNSDGLDTSVQLDNVAISSVPEPASIVLCSAVVGIGLCIRQLLSFKGSANCGEDE